MRIMVISTRSSGINIVWTYHHLILDGFAAQLLLNEVEKMYLGMLADSDSTAKSLLEREGKRCEVNLFSAYIEWCKTQKRMCMEEAIKFWRSEDDRLAAVNSHYVHRKDVPLDHQRNNNISSPRARDQNLTVKIHLSTEAAATLITSADQLHITPAGLTFGLWNLLLTLGCNSPSDGRKVGVSLANFSGRSEWDHTHKAIGTLINPLPAVVVVEPELQLATWLSNIQRTLSAIQRFEWLPLRSTLLLAPHISKRVHSQVYCFNYDSLPLKSSLLHIEEMEESTSFSLGMNVIMGSGYSRSSTDNKGCTLILKCDSKSYSAGELAYFLHLYNLMLEQINQICVRED